MAGSVLNIDGLLSKDALGCAIANMYQEYDTLRQNWKVAQEELQRYLFATDTTMTTNSKLPWKNKTTIPKLTQIRDNLYANYLAALFPKKDFVHWDADNEGDAQQNKAKAAKAYIANAMAQPELKNAIRKLLLDYIDTGNCFGGVEWRDGTQETDNGIKRGYVGPMIVRHNPFDIVFNPIASDFTKTPKIIRSLLTIGEVKKMLGKFGSPEIDAQAIFDYAIKLRQQVYQHAGSFKQQDSLFAIQGFSSFSNYLQSNYMELLTFRGDIYDVENDKFYENAFITVLDRHKVIDIKTDPAMLDTVPIYHCGWRIRQDNLYAQGPLENLVGMQYRVDHIENLKADVFDLTAAPPLKIKGLVNEFEWGPMARVVVDSDGDVEALAPDVQILQANVDIQNLMNLMEEMAGSPKEAAGFRTPGEKTKYEVQRLENAANRIFYARIIQFEEFLEKLMNAMLELARRKVNTNVLVSTFDDELKFQGFLSITPQDLSGNGRIRPRAASNFAERAEVVQNLSNFFMSAVGTDPEIRLHFSAKKLAYMFESLLDIQDYKVVTPYVRLMEQQEAQQLANAGEEQTLMATQTPAGLTPDDIG